MSRPHMRRCVMTWARVDDGFWCHPKLDELDEMGPNVAAQATGLWVRALSYCARRESGEITIKQVRRIVPWRPMRGIRALVDVGLWVELDDGQRWAFHDWSEYRAPAQNQAAPKARRKRIGRESTENRKRIARESEENRERIEPPRCAESLNKKGTPEPVPEPVLGTPTVSPCDDPAAGPVAQGLSLVVQDTPKAPKRKRRKRSEPAPSSAAWDAYAAAYFERYQVAPVRNARVNGQMANLVARLGAEDAPHVARFYVEAGADAFAARQSHPVGLLVNNCESLRTAWVRGRRVTRAEVEAEQGMDERRGRVEAAKRLAGRGA